MHDLSVSKESVALEFIFHQPGSHKNCWPEIVMFSVFFPDVILFIPRMVAPKLIGAI